MRSSISDRYNVEAQRHHPWSTNGEGSPGRYYDFTSDPELIRIALEDFVPYADRPAVESFYRLLERLNGDGSIFESNDSALAPPVVGLVTSDPALSHLYQADARLMFHFRDLSLNTDPVAVALLKRTLLASLTSRDRDMPDMDGTAVLSHAPCHFHLLARLHLDPAGRQVLVSLWSWGETEEETWRNLDRVVRNLDAALSETGELIRRMGSRYTEGLGAKHPHVFNIMVAESDFPAWELPETPKHLRQIDGDHLLCGERSGPFVFAATADVNILAPYIDQYGICPGCRERFKEIARDAAPWSAPRPARPSGVPHRRKKPRHRKGGRR